MASRVTSIPRIPPRRLLFAGGGVRGVAYVGFLEEIQKANLLKNVKEFCGVSAGAFFAFLLALGYSVSTIKTLCLEFDFSILPSVEPENLFMLFEEFGVDTGEKVEKFIESLLKHKKFSIATTFEQLFEKTKKKLRMWATDIQSLEPVEFSVEKTPQTPIAIALRASIAYPLYFTPVKDEQTGHLLIDGGVMDNYPISMLTEQEANETLGAAFVYENKVQEIANVLDVFRRTLSGFYRPTYQALLQKHMDKTVLIPCLEFPELHFQATQEERQEIMDIAAKTTRVFLQISIKPLYQRRRSVS